MAYKIEHVAKTLQAAREAKGISQRELSQLAGVPQSHISRIESGVIDLRLSSLIEIARVLGFEMTLVPRKALPAVQAIIRAGRSRQVTTDELSVSRELKRLQTTLNLIARQHSSVGAIAQTQRLVRDLQHLQGASNETAALKRANKAISKFKDNPQGRDALLQTLADLQMLRSKAANVTPSAVAPQPAYSLHDNDYE
jgi:transcriptional regulator with XRE-family HTH domain